MVLATDNAVHSTYLAKLEGLVTRCVRCCVVSLGMLPYWSVTLFVAAKHRSSDDGWRLCDPDDEKLVLQVMMDADLLCAPLCSPSAHVVVVLSSLSPEWMMVQMALHAADVSNPAKATDLCRKWADKIMVEFYQQGDKERELELPVSVGYDRDNPIPLEKMQAGFIIGIVRPLFHVMAQLPRVQLGHCMQHLDANLWFWQGELVRNQSAPPSPLLQAPAPADAAAL